MEMSMPRVELTAGTIEYEDTGTGPTVVILHGLLMNQSQWDLVTPLLPDGHRYVRPVLPLGGHQVAMKPDADLSLRGLVGLVAEFLDVLDLRDVTLVHTDWGGALFLTAYGLDARVGRMVVLPCEAYDNFPPGLPGKMAAMAARMPGGLHLAIRQIRIGRLRRLPIVFGRMAKHGITDEMARHWTEAALHDPEVRRDLRKYAKERFNKGALIADTEALAGFSGETLVIWSPECTVMPAKHGPMLTDLMPKARLVEIEDAYVLSMLDQPEAVAHAIGDFLLATT